MASSAGRAKRDREKAKQEKQALKRERKLAGPAEADDTAPSGPARPQDEVLADLAALHQRFDDEQISFDDFEDAKTALLAELQLG